MCTFWSLVTDAQGQCWGKMEGEAAITLGLRAIPGVWEAFIPKEQLDQLLFPAWVILSN